MKKIWYYSIIIIGVTICCPLSIASCEFNIKNIQYYHQSLTPYKINLNITDVCSSNIKKKRIIRNIEMNIYKDAKKISTLLFNQGLWMPSQKKFFLKFDKHKKSNCFKNASSLTINLKSNIINSTIGHFFNLENGNSLKIYCNELNKS